MGVGEGKTRLVLSIPVEVYQRLCDQAEQEKRKPCEIMVEAYLWSETLKKNLIGGKSAWDAMKNEMRITNEL